MKPEKTSQPTKDCTIQTPTSSSNAKSGYLNQDFRLFHLKDQVDREFDFHYHEFSKIVVFISGNVTYIIEGKSYYLKPWDILLVNNYAVHKPIIDSTVPYERIVIWVKNDFITSHNSDVCDISSCFRKANDRSFSMIRLNAKLQHQIQDLLISLEDSLNSEEFGAALLANSQFIQLMVYLNRIFLGKQYIKDKKSVKYDEKIEKLLRYINDHLTADLSIDALSHEMYLSKYHLMRKFKDETGMTLHSYILQKRLMYARQMMDHGTPVMEAAQESGFCDYTTFSRAYKKMFHHAPTKKITQKSSYSQESPVKQSLELESL